MDDKEIFSLDNLPASVTSVVALQIGAFADVDSGSTDLSFSIINGADESAVEVTVNSTDITYHTGMFELDAAGDAFTTTNVNATSIAVEVI